MCARFGKMKRIPPSEAQPHTKSTHFVLFLVNNALSFSLSLSRARVRNKDEEQGKGRRGQTDDDDDDDDVTMIIRSGSKTE